MDFDYLADKFDYVAVQTSISLRNGNRDRLAESLVNMSLVIKEIQKERFIGDLELEYIEKSRQKCN